MRTFLLALAGLLAFATPAAAQPVYARPVNPEPGPIPGSYLIENAAGNCIGQGPQYDRQYAGWGPCTAENAVRFERAGDRLRMTIEGGRLCLALAFSNNGPAAFFYTCTSGYPATQTFTLRFDSTLGRYQIVSFVEGVERCLATTGGTPPLTTAFIRCSDPRGIARFGLRPSGPMYVQPARNDPLPGSRTLPPIQPLIIVPPPAAIRPAPGLYRLQASNGSCIATGLMDPERGTAPAYLTPDCPTGTQFRIRHQGKTAEGKDRFSLEVEGSGLCLRAAGIGTAVPTTVTHCGSDESYWFELPITGSGHQIRKQGHCFTIPTLVYRLSYYPCQGRPEQRFTLLPV
ncbi:hypothetical protein P1X14_19695 [Sphingomonas sp. AOB5]|uniref:hypothetical protein n=1 Tax=Sphingomonas sp. AOB5 TaxID=3034017 RepID=UPI0023F9355B|nr:hypothetical protein [Sphingomonas sp. AOB5]MDF7777491.1 hypothetical protein [Sphingomonas sp. AOB5]